MRVVNAGWEGDYAGGGQGVVAGGAGAELGVLRGNGVHVDGRLVLVRVEGGAVRSAGHDLCFGLVVGYGDRCVGNFRLVWSGSEDGRWCEVYMGALGVVMHCDAWW